MADTAVVTRLILLDRDGVINQDSPDYIKSVDEFIPIPGALEAMAKLYAAGFRLGVCTNQSALGRGLVSEKGLAEIHQRLGEALAEQGAVLEGIRHCPHLPDDGCDCRKPEPGMLIELMTALEVAPSDTVFVGDSLKDVQAALAAGCRPVLVRTGNGSSAEGRVRAAGVDEIFDDLAAFGEAEIARSQAAGAQQ